MSTPLRIATTRRPVAIACVLAALVLVVLDAAIVNLALPEIARALSVTPAESVRVITAYQLGLVMALLPCAALGEARGYRPVYTVGVAVFVAASVLCAWAPSLTWLLLARFVQGLGGAAVMALGLAILRFVVPPEELGAAIGWNTLTVALASAAGPTVGALVLSVARWPWLFAVNLPIGALVLYATRMLPEVPGSARKLDLVSAALNAFAFGAAVMGAELMPERAPLAIMLVVLAGAAMIVLVRRELPKHAPLFPIDLLRSGSFALSVVASVCCFIGQSAAIVSLPFYLQHGLGLSPLRTGLLITPWPLSVALVAPLAGRLTDRLSSAWLCALGGALLSAGLALAAGWPLASQPYALVPWVMLCGAGFGLFQVSNNRNMLMSAPEERSGAAGGMQATARLTGQALGGVLMTLVFALVPLARAPRVGLAVASGLALVAAAVQALQLTPYSRRLPRAAAR